MTEQNGPTGRARLRAATAWVTWHATELVALGLSVALALTVSLWLWAVAVLIGAAWVTREIRQHRRRAALRGQLPARQLASGLHDQPEAAAEPQNARDRESRHA